MTIENLFRQGLLKKIVPSTERSRKSIEVAERYLKDAGKTVTHHIYDLAIIAAYSATFHAARAILFKDGIAERSHFAIYEYLKEKHKEFGITIIETFDHYRKLRHSTAYGLDTVVGQKDAVGAVNFANEFVKKAKEYLMNEVAVQLYTEGKVTLAKAAELAGLGVEEFKEMLSEMGIKVTTPKEDEKELRAAIKTLKMLGKKKISGLKAFSLRKLTIREAADALGIPYRDIEKLIEQAGIPITDLSEEEVRQRIKEIVG